MFCAFEWRIRNLRGFRGFVAGQIIFVMVYVFRHLPYLKDVILGNTGNDPILAGIPGEIRYLASVATVNKQQLGRAILCILQGLFLVDPV